MTYSPRLPRPARLIAPLLAGALIAAVPPTPAAPAAPHHTACPQGDGSDGWALSATRIDPDSGFDAFVGNGYLGQRVAPHGAGYAATGAKTGWPLFTPRYDGSFVAGLYARGPGTTEGRQVAAALPTWTALDVTTGGPGAQTYSSATPTGRISHYRQTLHLRCGLVRTSLTWTASDGRATDLVYDVLADRVRAHVGAVRLRMTPRWSGEATVTDRIDGRGARRISQTGGSGYSYEGRTMDVAFRTDGTGIDGAVASTLLPGAGVGDERPHTARPVRDLSARQTVTFPVERGRSYELAKYVGVDTALTARTPRAAARAAARQAAERGWSALLAGHAAAWERLWRADIEVAGRKQGELRQWVRSAQYGLLSATRAGARDSISPTGLSSDNYAGLIFWDADTWMYPSLLAAHPELARTVVEYRYRTRAAARANARGLGHPGLFYGWTSASEGDLWSECHSWEPPHCRTQNHLQSDIALAAWQYYLATGDAEWLRGRGWPVLKGIAEFWAGRATRNGDGSYSVKDVAGPDEYSNGVDDAVFTNAGAATALRAAARAAHVLGEPAPAEWTRIAAGLRIPYDEKRQVFWQYEGYDGSLIKQADTVLLMYPLEWPMSARAAANTLDYYAARTDPDGPAMTDSVHAIDAAGIGEPGCAAYTYLLRAIKPFVRGPFALFSEARGQKAGAADPLSGSPAQDFLTGKGGFLQIFAYGLTGMRMREDRVRLDPMLPPQLAAGVTLRGLRWQGRTYDVAIGAHETVVRLTGGAPFTVETPEGDRLVSAGAPAVLKTRRPDLVPTDNLARCRAATASSEEPGMYAGAALDGSAATAWVPDGTAGTLTADLGRTLRIAEVMPEWTATRPVSYAVETSPDGRRWHAGESGLARYVRVTLRSADDKKRAGIAELSVTSAG
ncbi:glycosyl hydrolase family 65 protein [Streptomyces sp. ME19-01-6]|uniref:glycosyl hydrolase family 65 protein n=1 Tax=Streptomyces sp. ME19-01-6 TaxID=3028686 RepID=UPI0029A9D495|nr:glycosyl hydrolase family 65 protein [Streptomyces sp. ME19-01-6]MDX3229849.1 discoidin domain-containing protein [Streptomyces sp. ME19-01-6]